MKIKLIEIQEAAWKTSWPCTRIFMMFMLLQKALHTTACNSIIQWNSCLCLHRYLRRFEFCFVLFCCAFAYFIFLFVFFFSHQIFCFMPLLLLFHLLFSTLPLFCPFLIVLFSFANHLHSYTLLPLSAMK